MLLRLRGRRHAWDLPNKLTDDEPGIIARFFHSEVRVAFHGQGSLLSDCLLGVMVDNRE